MKSLISRKEATIDCHSLFCCCCCCCCFRLFVFRNTLPPKKKIQRSLLCLSNFFLSPRLPTSASKTTRMVSLVVLWLLVIRSCCINIKILLYTSLRKFLELYKRNPLENFSPLFRNFVSKLWLTCHRSTEKQWSTWQESRPRTCSSCTCWWLQD